jgi:translation initiation factor 2B subunit (eIF-2B alpha/beta/delta family)
VNTEVKDQTKALESYKKAEQEFQGDRHLEMYIEESIPMVEGHAKMAKLLQQHMQQKTASNAQ